MITLALVPLLLTQQPTIFRAGNLEIELNPQGFIQAARIGAVTDFIPKSVSSAILSLKIGNKIEVPQNADWNPRRGLLTLDFGGHKAVVHVTSKPTHLVLELERIQPEGDVDAAVWGPYATTLKGSIGDTIGVVQGEGLALGLQVLNPKTLGGFPNSDDDAENGYGFQETPGGPTEGYRSDTARPTSFGSVIQAYVRNRSKTRIIANWAHPFYTAPAFKDGGLAGSKIALFGCRAEDALSTVGDIEVAEGLPHPMIDGVWGKISPTAHESYFIMGYGVKSLDESLAVTKAAGLKYLYSDSCFETWGHFKLKPEEFPQNGQSLKDCVAKAKVQGVRLGVHTLSNFITPNDPYVTPKPDPRLAEVGSTTLAESLNESQTEVAVSDPKFFNEMANNTLRTVRVGDELVQYDSVSPIPPWRLLKCKRGVFGTTPASHNKGDRIAKLMDHGYGTFLTNAALSQEVARNIADLFNFAGLQQLSMDGIEGNWSTGMGQYGRVLFAKAWYDHLSPELKGQVIDDASGADAYNWHIHTRQNWGEPWYAGFRKSQTQYRLDNQRYFRRNLMPGMLGWFSLQADTTPEDVEWMLARAAGFDAGFAITTSLDAIHDNRTAQEILADIKSWESARRAHAFPDSLLPGLQDVNREFELEQLDEKKWTLTEIDSEKFSYTSGDLRKSFTVPQNATGVILIIQIPKDVNLSDWGIDIDGVGPAISLVANRRIKADLSKLKPGNHIFRFQGHLSGPKDAAIDFELRIPKGEPITLG